MNGSGIAAEWQGNGDGWGRDEVRHKAKLLQKKLASPSDHAKSPWVSGGIAAAGYVIEPRRYVEEKVSGSVPGSQRPGFARLLEKMEPGDTLIVTKLDRIGRDSIDVQQTVSRFAEQGMRLIVLQLGNLDLTSSAGALMVKVLAAMADFERDLIIERTQAGHARARAEGKHMGRPAKTTESQRQTIHKALGAGRRRYGHEHGREVQGQSRHHHRHP